ncbi:MAG: peptidoglycan D,D-transpeptidase FtsI family protein [Thermoleophilaceae bacterium]
MNRQVRHLFGLVVVLFALLVAFTSNWTVFTASSLEDNSANRRPLLEQQLVPRGLVLARDGTRLAESDGSGRGQRRRYKRRYPQGTLFSHAVGYSFIELGRAGIEQSRNDELTGAADSVESFIDELLGRTQEGDDLVTALDPKGQRAALQALGGQRGSIVAIEPETGRIRVMVSVPGFDPNEVPDEFRELNADEDSPLFNRATQGRYPPGSTMKVVTAAAALDSGRFTPDSVLDGASNKRIGGVPLQNFGNQDYGPTSLTEALTNSVNTVWAQVAQQLGKEEYYDYMERFGFNVEPPMDYPPDQLTPSGVYGRRGRLLDEDDPVDIGRVAIGQERLQVTPLQMATVAATVANEGSRMEPRLGERVVARDGRLEERVRTAEAAQVMSRDSANQLKAMMAQVVKEGSGTQAALEGVPVAGKTGTAEVEGGATNQAWFIGFAPLDDPKMAVAVTVERTSGQGGTVAAPIAKKVLQALLSGRRG